MGKRKISELEKFAKTHRIQVLAKLREYSLCIIWVERGPKPGLMIKKSSPVVTLGRKDKA